MKRIICIIIIGILALFIVGCGEIPKITDIDNDVQASVFWRGWLFQTAISEDLPCRIDLFDNSYVMIRYEHSDDADKIIGDFFTDDENITITEYLIYDEDNNIVNYSINKPVIKE
jgi:hypothetical protein